MNIGSCSEGKEFGVATTLLKRIDVAVRCLERALAVGCMLAILAASVVLSFSAVGRHLFALGNAFQDELVVFLLVSAVFLSAAQVQNKRGHIAIEIVEHPLFARLDRARQIAVDGATAAFCIFFAYKSWQLVKLAWIEKHTSTSTWAPDLWFPYSLMALGMSLLAVRLAVQVLWAAIESRAET
jgi:TRAP-type C4-dicarboxylate transport system permease small subunit